MQIDVADDASVARAAADVEAHEGRIDLLVNNADIVGAHRAADELTGSDALALYQTNLIGPIRVTHAFVPLLDATPAPERIKASALARVEAYVRFSRVG